MTNSTQPETTQGASSSSVTESGGGHGGSDGGSGGGADASGMDFTPVENTAAEIDEMYLNEDLPAATGGGDTLEGIYELVSRTLYTGPTGKTGPTGTKFKETVAFKVIGPGLMFARAAVRINGVEHKVFFKATIHGTELRASLVGGGTGSPVWGFDMTPEGANIHVDANGVPVLSVFKRR